MKKSLLIAGGFLAAVLLTQCGAGANDGRRDATTVGKNGWVFEGWACAPDASMALKGLSPAHYCKGKKADYLYLKFSARASSKAIRLNSPGMKQSTCREASRLQVAADGLAKILGEHLEKASGVSDGQSTGVAIISQTKGLLTGVGIYDCCAVNVETGKCAEIGEKEDWKECQCVGYMKFPGGKKGLETKAKKIEAGN